ncbi:hypothetical protein PF004_g31933 [Phytophthora fragariae]|uniref:Pectate lyase n=1 Tax=Phytophthora fragariae TaxID=53985 RepID=A0A6G0M7P5_9STRA|nr:hypothetical protein PF004_g31933 [Phytophthora fragariae]
MNTSSTSHIQSLIALTIIVAAPGVFRTCPPHSKTIVIEIRTRQRGVVVSSENGNGKPIASANA